jgi:hypothetical protein
MSNIGPFGLLCFKLFEADGCRGTRCGLYSRGRLCAFEYNLRGAVDWLVLVEVHFAV